MLLSFLYSFIHQFHWFFLYTAFYEIHHGGKFLAGENKCIVKKTTRCLQAGHCLCDPSIPIPVVTTLGRASMDRQRLNQRLKFYGLCEVEVSKDGNCQFRALSYQFNSPGYHMNIRKDVVKQLKNHRVLYESYVEMDYKVYCEKMAK